MPRGWCHSGGHGQEHPKKYGTGKDSPLWASCKVGSAQDTLGQREKEIPAHVWAAQDWCRGGQTHFQAIAQRPVAGAAAKAQQKIWDIIHVFFNCPATYDTRHRYCGANLPSGPAPASWLPDRVLGRTDIKATGRRKYTAWCTEPTRRKMHRECELISYEQKLNDRVLALVFVPVARVRAWSSYPASQMRSAMAWWNFKLTSDLVSTLKWWSSEQQPWSSFALSWTRAA